MLFATGSAGIDDSVCNCPEYTLWYELPDEDQDILEQYAELNVIDLAV